MLRDMSLTAVTMFASVLAFTGCESEQAPLPETLPEEAQATGDYIFCGGFANLPCPEGFVCKDNPFDACNPQRGGADCGGICVAPTQCGGEDRDYVSKDPNTCAVVLFRCPEGERPFSDQCGCGCEPEPVGEECGGNVCGPGQFCCNASCGICAPKGGACIQIACE